MLRMPTAISPQMAADALCSDGMLERNLPNNWNITNLGAILRRAGICEELGSGIRKATLAIESSQLPPPRFETPPDFTQVTIFARQDFFEKP